MKVSACQQVKQLTPVNLQRKQPADDPTRLEQPIQRLQILRLLHDAHAGSKRELKQPTRPFAPHRM